jgi:hypothetical protein
MKFIHWDIPFNAQSKRSIELTRFVYGENKLVFQLFDEETETHWELRFNDYQAVKITNEECDSGIWSLLPDTGAFYQTENSDWLKELGKGDVNFLNDSTHFVFCCYDELIEVVSDFGSVEFSIHN